MLGYKAFRCSGWLSGWAEVILTYRRGSDSVSLPMQHVRRKQLSSKVENALYLKFQIMQPVCHNLGSVVAGWGHYLGAADRNLVCQYRSAGCKAFPPSLSQSDSQWSSPTDPPSTQGVKLQWVIPRSNPQCRGSWIPIPGSLLPLSNSRLRPLGMVLPLSEKGVMRSTGSCPSYPSNAVCRRGAERCFSLTLMF